MKKILAFILIAFTVFSLISCNTDSSADNGEAGTSQNQTNNGSESGGQTTEKNEMIFSGLTVVDTEECFIKITEIDADSIWGYTLKVQLENRSEDKTYMFSVESAAINGVQCDPLFANEVAAGKKANKDLSFSDSQFKESGIKEYTDIEITFRVYDSDNWTADNVAKKTVHVYPYGEAKAVKYVRASSPTDNIIVDNEYVTVIVTGYEQDSIWGYTVKLFLVNKTDKNIMFSADEVSVNGYMLDPLFAKSVSKNKCAFTSMSWSDSKFEANGITEVEEIEFNIRVYDNEDWFDDDLVNKTVTVNP